jgi:REP-associated tyrosine transposase
MSRFRKLSHAIWHCQYHVVWTPKYRYRILAGQVREEVTNCIHSFSEQLRCEVVELNVQSDHVHRVPRSGRHQEGDATCCM